jgi:hypothetical protein
MSHITVVFGILAGVSAAIAAFHAYKASTIKPRPAWDYDPELRPRNMEEHNFGMLNALDAAQFWSSRSSKMAALWAVISAVFAIIAAIV